MKPTLLWKKGVVSGPKKISFWQFSCWSSNAITLLLLQPISLDSRCGKPQYEADHKFYCGTVQSWKNEGELSAGNLLTRQIVAEVFLHETLEDMGTSSYDVAQNRQITSSEESLRHNWTFWLQEVVILMMVLMMLRWLMQFQLVQHHSRLLLLSQKQLQDTVNSF